MPAQEFQFGMTLTGGLADTTMMTGVCRSVLVQIGLGGDGADRLIEQVLAAQRAGPKGACTVKFTAHAGELEIALSQGGREWHTSCPLPIR